MLRCSSYPKASSNVLKGAAGDDTAGFEIIDGDDLDGMAEAEGAPAERQPGRRAATDQPLAVSLPTSLGLEPARLSAMRSSLFQSSRRPLQVINPPGYCVPCVMHRYPRAPLQGSSWRSLLHEVQVSISLCLMQRRRGGEQGFGEAAGAPVPVPAAAAPNAWRDTAPALQAPRHAVAQGSPLPRLLTPALASPPPSSLPPAAELQETSTSAEEMVDAGLMLGQTSRVGWGPSGVFAHIGACGHARL